MPTTDNKLARTTDPNQSLAAMLDSAAVELRKVAPKYVNVQRMIALAIEAKQRNQLLANCSPISVVNFCKRCAEAGTDRIGAGGMWAVPFWNSKANCYDMTPIPDWRLLIEKAKKAKAIKHATAEAVFENDFFEYERGMEPRLVHKPALSNRGKVKAVYCVYVLPDDTKDFVVMDWEADVVPIRDRTNAWKSWIKDKRENPWVTAEVEQGKKTVVKRAMKLFEGASPELTRLIEVDNVVNGFGEIDTTPRIPIAEPKAIAHHPDDIVVDAEPKPEPKPTKAEKPEPAYVPDGCQIVTGTLDDVSVKSGTGKKGAWTKFGLQIGGAWYGTFDKDIGELAQTMKGKEVSVLWKQDGEYKTVQSVAEDVPPPFGDSTPGAGDSAVVQDLMAYESGFPRMFAKGCDHVHISAAEWKSAPSEALAKLKAWLDVESTRD